MIKKKKQSQGVTTKDISIYRNCNCGMDTHDWLVSEYFTSVREENDLDLNHWNNDMSVVNGGVIHEFENKDKQEWATKEQDA